MEALITFRESIDSLTDIEYEQCVASIGRELVTSIIFIGLHSQIYDNKMDNLIQINEIITQFKESQENDDNIEDNQIEEMELSLINNNDEKETVTLDNIPSVLLSKIASFLIFNDKIRLEQTNRSIFIGVRFYKL
eukprot:345085_1